MPNRPVPATGEAMPVAHVTRRATLCGLAGASAAGLGLARPASSAPLPDATLAAYMRQTGALERLEHHLHHAAMAAGELCPAEGSRWIFTGSGKAWARPYFRLARLDLVREPDGGLSERMFDMWDSVNGMAGSARS